MYVQNYSIEKDQIPIRNYLDEATVYYVSHPKVTYKILFDSDAEAQDFLEWIFSVQGKGFRDPRRLSEDERKQFAEDTSKEIIEQQDRRIASLSNTVDELKGKIKSMEEEIERHRKGKIEGSISSLEI